MTLYIDVFFFAKKRNWENKINVNRQTDRRMGRWMVQKVKTYKNMTYIGYPQTVIIGEWRPIV